MFLVKNLLFVFGVALIFIIPKGECVLSENCITCICEASTGCNVSSACQDPSSGYYCGPFLISQPYWIDAQRPILANDNPKRNGAFENCVLDIQCAAKTVRNYMTKFKQDCNNDGKIDCEDYVRIHYLGGDDCTHTRFVETEFYKLHLKCYEGKQQASFSLE